MTPDITITVHDNTPLEFKSDIYRMNTDGDTTYQIIPLDDPDGFNADWNPDTHVFRIWHYDVVDHVSEHRAGSITDAVELLRRYLNS